MKHFFLFRFVLIGVLVATLSACGSDNGSDVDILVSEDFGSYTIGNPFNSSSWAALDGGAMPGWTIQEAVKALDVNSAGAIVYAGAGSSTWTNYTFAFNFKVSNTTEIASAYFRFIGGAEPGMSYYFINIDGGNTLSLGKCPSDVGGCYAVGLPATISYVAGTYYPVLIRMNHNNVQIYFDGATTPNIDYTDDGSAYGPLQHAGSIGVGSPNPANVYFDDIVVTPIPTY
jgi:hypothetical protein